MKEQYLPDEGVTTSPDHPTPLIGVASRISTAKVEVLTLAETLNRVADRILGSMGMDDHNNVTESIPTNGEYHQIDQELHALDTALAALHAATARVGEL